ncbi:MAG: hypothetical protein IJL83_04065 [Clostridia bacterium]|nr:hypothetical protein [Clostridia bacterium]
MSVKKNLVRRLLCAAFAAILLVSAATRERARVNAGAEALGELFDASEPELEDAEESEYGDCDAAAKR